VTFLHYVEHVADIPGKRIARYQVPVMENGCRVWRAMEEFGPSPDRRETARHLLLSVMLVWPIMDAAMLGGMRGQVNEVASLRHISRIVAGQRWSRIST
jgi:Aminoglycoside 3-N-acetyltransferase